MTEPTASWTLVRTDTFLRELRKYLLKHPDRHHQVRDRLAALAADPYAPALRLHALKGRMKGLHAVRLFYSDRIVIVLVFMERQVVLLGIGTHGDVYR